MNMVASSGLPRVALIAGPTASGKSALAIRVAEAMDGVVINADSAQVYADLRILSARPSLADEAQVPHRLFGDVDAAHAYSAAQWARDATAEIDAAVVADRLPILVGGTGLYLRTLLDGIAPVPEIDSDIRAAVRGLDVADAYRQLTELDPEAAARLAPADTTRVARALEVVSSSGRPLAAWQQDRVGGIGERIALAPLIMLPDRDWIAARCDDRLRAMFDEGAADEVRVLLARADVPPGAPALRAIGVPEIAGWLRDEWPRDEALARAQLATRRYAKRQFTWFRNQPPVHWRRSALRDTAALLETFEAIMRGGGEA